MSPSSGVPEHVRRAAIVCLACKTRKRKCDKCLPQCSNCDRLKRTCRYDYNELRAAASSIWAIEISSTGPTEPCLIQDEDASSELSISFFTGLRDGLHRDRYNRAPVTVCERCRYQKRACDRAWPNCSRCAKYRVPCMYKSSYPSSANRLSSASADAPFATIDRLWTGIVDPFHTNPLSFPPDLVNHCNVYRISVLAPCLTPGSSELPEVPIVRYWFPPTYNDPTLFITTLLCVLSHQRRRWILTGQRADGTFRPQDAQWLDWCYVEGIRKINRALDDEKSAVTDNMILNVLIMAAADGGTVSMSALESPFQAPLRSLQWLDVYGSVSASPIHLRGLAQLIHMRGGLKMVQLPGLGAILSFFELINCSRTLSHPQFSFISLQGIENPTLSEYFMFDSKGLKDRFVDLYRVGCSEEYLAVLQAIRIHLLELERYMEGLLANLDLRQLSDRRNLIQYCLMSLRPASGRETGQANLAEACRLSTIILSVGVIFPLSGNEAPFSALANMLRAEIESCGGWVIASEPQYTTIMIWFLTLGGIAATRTPSRAWYAEKLSTISTTSTAGWLEIKKRLQTVLWLSSACDYAGELLWKEVEMLKTSRLCREIPTLPSD